MTRLRTAMAILTSLVSVPALVGCQQGLEITVTGAGDRVMFSVPATDPPCVDELRVSLAADPKQILWSIDSSDSNRCDTRFTYGELPDGFTQNRAATPLARGTLYEIVIERPGAFGIEFFEPGGNGSIERDPPPDRR